MRRSADEIRDELLVLDAQAGSRGSFEELFRRWNPRLLRFAWRLTGREDAARDAVQEGWLAIVRGLNGLSDPAGFPAWACRIVRFKAADQFRKEARQSALPRKDATAPPPPEGSLPSVLEGLSPEDRAILTLYYLDGFGIDEIGGVFDLPGGTVKSRLFHARSRLKDILERKTI